MLQPFHIYRLILNINSSLRQLGGNNRDGRGAFLYLNLNLVRMAPKVNKDAERCKVRMKVSIQKNGCNMA